MASLPWLLCTQCMFFHSFILLSFLPLPLPIILSACTSHYHTSTAFIIHSFLLLFLCSLYSLSVSFLTPVVSFHLSLFPPLTSSLPSPLRPSPLRPSLPLPPSISDSRASAADTAAVSGGGLPQPRQPQGHPHRQSSCGKEPL